MSDGFVPAAGRAALRLYDPALALTMRERRFRGRLLGAVGAALPPGGRVADLGCGTGTLAIALAAARPDATVTGLDPDDDALAIARGKPGADRVAWQRGRAEATGLPGGAADAVVFSLVLHHLEPEPKRAALREARRLLADGGTLHVADWGRPAGLVARAGFFALRCLDGFPNTADHAAGRLGALIAEAGFARVHRHTVLPTVWGTLELLRAAPRA